MFRKVLLSVVLVLAVLVAGAGISLAASPSSNSYIQTNLVSDIPGMAKVTDPNLVNPWGLSHGPLGPWKISDNGTGLSSTYTDSAIQVPPKITIPLPPGGTGAAAPTGNVINKAFKTDPNSFVVTKGAVSGPSKLIFATEDGTISGWNRAVDKKNAILAVDRSTATDNEGNVGAVYKGLAYGSSGGEQFIYATNFRFGTVEMFDENFNLVKSFTDPQITAIHPFPNQGFSPFGIQNIGGKLYVTFALQDAAKHDDVGGLGNGFVDVFNTDGTLAQRLIAQGKLNSPWGLVKAPADFGPFSNDLLVGNFGDGKINAYSIADGTFHGKLKLPNGNPIAIKGLWGIAFGNGAQAGKSNELFFAAGINGEAHGLFGKFKHSGN